MALSGDMLRSHRRRKVLEPAAEVQPVQYDRAMLRQYKPFFTKPPAGLKDTEFMCVIRHERCHQIHFTRDMMKQTFAVGENAWHPKQRASLSEQEEYAKAVRGMLNKLTPDKYETIIDRFDLTRVYNDDTTIDLMVRSIFDKALAEPAYSLLYTRLCYDILIAGKDHGCEFRKRIIGHAQTEFEETMESTQKTENEEEGKLSKRQNTNIKFVCELAQEGVLSSKVIRSIINKLLKHEPGSGPDDACIEMLAMIMTTVGNLLEEKDHAYLESIVSKLQELLRTIQYQPRTRFMLMDMLELRDNRWVPRIAKTKVPAKVDQDGNAAPSVRSLGMALNHATSAPLRKSVVPTSSVKGLSFASVVGGNNSNQKSSGSQSRPSVEATSVCAPPSGEDPSVYEKEEKDLIIKAVSDMDPSSVKHLDIRSVLLTAQIEFCKSGKREECTNGFSNHTLFKITDRVEAFSSCLSIGIIEDMLVDVPKFEERWTQLISGSFNMSSDIQYVVESIAQCIQKVIFSEEDGNYAESTCPLILCLQKVWNHILTALKSQPVSCERTEQLLKGLEDVFNIPNLPSTVADTLVQPLLAQKILLDAETLDSWMLGAVCSVAGQKLKAYFSKKT